MWKKPIQTNFMLWGILSALFFIAIGSINWIPEGKNICFWSQWSLFFEMGGYQFVNSDFVFALVFGGIAYLIPSIVLGWIIQALIQTWLTFLPHSSIKLENEKTG